MSNQDYQEASATSNGVQSDFTRCNNCKVGYFTNWLDKREHQCPHCGTVNSNWRDRK